jgi:hypothetical protein
VVTSDAGALLHTETYVKSNMYRNLRSALDNDQLDRVAPVDVEQLDTAEDRNHRRSGRTKARRMGGVSRLRRFRTLSCPHLPQGVIARSGTEVPGRLVETPERVTPPLPAPRRLSSFGRAQSW